MKQAQRQMVELEEFAAVCRERDAAREDAETYRKQAHNLDELRRELGKERNGLQERVEELIKEKDDVESELKIAHMVGEKLVAQRDNFQTQLSAVESANDALQKELKRATENVGKLAAELQRTTEEREAMLAKVKELEAYVSLLKTAQDKCDAARQEADYLRKRCQRAEEGAASAVKAQEEVIERLKAQNVSFVEERRDAQDKAARLTKELDRARNDVSRLVELNDAFKDRLAKVTQEKNDVVGISNGFARERDEIRAEYDARGKVIKKLRKRLHKLKKKLKH